MGGLDKGAVQHADSGAGRLDKGAVEVSEAGGGGTAVPVFAHHYRTLARV